MPEPDATLRDVTVDPNPSTATAAAAAPAKEPADKPEVKEPELKVTDNEAVEIGRLMLESGYTRDKVNQVLEAPQALNSLRYLINNNPTEFLNLLERTDPTTGERFLETMADTYVKRYAPKGDSTQSNGASKGNDSPELMSQIAALREQVQGFQTAQQQRDNAAAMAQIKSRYDARVDDLFSQLPKDLSLNKAEVKALRAQLNEELGADPNVVQRVSNGNFVDVPSKFKSVIEGWSMERKAAAEATTKSRERTTSNAFADFSAGPQALSVDVPTGAFDSWEATEEAFGAALEKASR